MATLFSLLIQYVVSFFLGVSYVEPQDKPFLKESYYETPQGELNYFQLYKDTLNVSTGKEECNTGKFMFNTNSGRKRVQDSVSNGWLFYASTSNKLEDLIKNATKDENISAYVFKVPAGTEIIAPYNSTLVNSSLSTVDNVYPDESLGKSMGIYMQMVTDTTEDGDQFRLTFGSIGRHWCCMSKKKPLYKVEGDTTTPYYEHTFTPAEKYKFNAGDVIAEAGQSGLPKGVRDQNSEAYIFLKVEKKVMGGGFVSASVEDLYNR